MMCTYLSALHRGVRFLLILTMIGASLSPSWAKEQAKTLTKVPTKAPTKAPPPPQKKQQKGPAPSLLVPPQEPISIDADHLSILESKHQAVFKGNVHAIQDGVHMSCSQLTVSYASTSDMPISPSKKIQEEPHSASETSLVEGVTVTSLECDGPVTMKSDDQVVTGKHASFDKGAQVIKVSGDAKLVQGSNILTGDRILYSLPDRVARVEGHVKALFTPKESGASKNSSGQ